MIGNAIKVGDPVWWIDDYAWMVRTGRATSLVSIETADKITHEVRIVRPSGSYKTFLRDNLYRDRDVALEVLCHRVVNRSE